MCDIFPARVSLFSGLSSSLIMKPVVLAVLVLVASAVATPVTRNDHPRPEHDSSLRGDRSEEISLRNGISRLSSQLLERVPNAAEVMGMTQEQVETRSADGFINILDEVCNAGHMYGAIKPNYAPPRDRIEMHLTTSNGEVSAPLSQPQRILEAQALREEKEVVIYITGMKSTSENSPLNKLKEAYKCRGNVNFLVIDLGRYITNVQTLLTLDNEQVGEWVAELLNEITKKVSINKIHLIGHGVGAHVAGAAARKYTEMTGHLLPRITGLDPALICYKQHNVLYGLQKGDAEFVDVIHSSTYGYGKPEASGDVDFYPNGPSIVQPGLRDLVSSHNIAVEFYAETVIPGNEENFLAQKCNSMKNLRSRACQRKQIPMGISTPRDASGNFFLQTKTTYPFGSNASQSARNHQCWKN